MARHPDRFETALEKHRRPVQAHDREPQGPCLPGGLEKIAWESGTSFTTHVAGKGPRPAKRESTKAYLEADEAEYA